MPKLLAFAASLRRDSWHKKLVRVAAEHARAAGAEVTLRDFREFEGPMFDQDLLSASGLPPGPQAFSDAIAAHDGILLATPEYNYSIPGTLKNLIDWVSRPKPVVLKGKSALLLGTSSGQIGGIRGLWQTRIPLEGLGVFVYPEMFYNGPATQLFTDEGTIRDPKIAGWLEGLVKNYVAWSDRLRLTP